MLLQIGLAVISGLLLSAAFPPVEWDFLIWAALVPLLLVPIPLPHRRRLACGFIFGLAHTLTNLFWLNTIGFGAGVWLALICAFFPMAWYWFAGTLILRLGRNPDDTTGNCRRIWEMDPVRQALLMLLLSAAWVALEWVRSWIFTGFSWNQLGISQYRRLNLLGISAWTGVYGISFLIIAMNLALAMSWSRTWRNWTGKGPRGGFSLPLALVVILTCVAVIVTLRQARTGMPDRKMRAVLVQGNIPQCREWTQAQLDESSEVYTSLTRAAVQATAPDLVVWPETAVPAPALWDRQYADALRALFAEIKTPFLLGTIDQRPAGKDDFQVTNSAMLFDPAGRLVETYDKIHRVPFGEYTPFGHYLPWLQEWIGMGRDLTAGREFTVFTLPGEIRAGVMICYEDAFGRLARQFVLRGATLLVTVTNDAWYAESAGSKQHLTQAVFRAVENRRPLLRSGNNSDSCLIWPNGRISGIPLDPKTGSRFTRTATLYEVPIWDQLPVTWYSRHGDVFAMVCGGLTVLILASLGWDRYQRKAGCFEVITGAAEQEKTGAPETSEGKG